MIAGLWFAFYGQNLKLKPTAPSKISIIIALIFLVIQCLSPCFLRQPSNNGGGKSRDSSRVA